MVPGSLPLASAPQRFPVGELGFSAFLAGGCGFVTVDSVRGSGVAAPERCRRYFFQGWQPPRIGSAPTLLQRGLCGYAASPGPVFFAPALGTEYGMPLPDPGHSSRQERFRLYTCLLKRCEWG